MSRLTGPLALLVEEVAFVAGRRRRELEALISMAEQIERTDDSSSVARILLDAAVSSFEFPRGLVLASADGHLPLLASYGLEEETARRPGRPGPSAVVAEAHEQKATVLFPGLDVEDDPWLARLLPSAVNLLVIPLTAEGRSLGALVLEHTGRAGIPSSVISWLERSTSYAAMAVRNAWMLEQVQRLAATDALTGIANRRTFESTLEREIANASRRGGKLSLVVIDIDHFKQVNDNLGHQVGDEVLRNFASALSAACRRDESLARYGGEEFCVVLPGIDAEGALLRADELRRAAAAGCHYAVTASAGVETWASEQSSGSLFNRADAALYASKQRGRDQTTSAHDVQADEHKPPSQHGMRIIVPDPLT